MRTSSMSWSGSNPVIATSFIQSSPSFWASVPASLKSADSRIADTRMPITTLVSAGRKFSAESPAANSRAATRATRTNRIDTPTPQYEPFPPPLKYTQRLCLHCLLSGNPPATRSFCVDPGGTDDRFLSSVGLSRHCEARQATQGDGLSHPPPTPFHHDAVVGEWGR